MSAPGSTHQKRDCINGNPPTNSHSAATSAQRTIRIKISELLVLWNRVLSIELNKLSTIESRSLGDLHGSCHPVSKAIGKFAIPLTLSCGGISPSMKPSSAHGLKVIVSPSS